MIGFVFVLFAIHLAPPCSLLKEMSSMCPAQVDGKQERLTPVKVLLPHEILHALADSQSQLLFESVLLGNLEASARIAFFKHLAGLKPYKDHPVLQGGEAFYDKLVGWTLHGDGAQIYRDDEYFCWSISSVFSSMGVDKDILLVKYPVAIIPERFMKSYNVSKHPKQSFTLALFVFMQLSGSF